MTFDWLVLLVLLPLAPGLAGCTGKDVVAEVGSRKVRLTDLDELKRLRGDRQLSAEKALDAVIARERLAEAAKRAGITDDEAVKARLRAAEREVLAQALVDRELSKVTEQQAVERFKAHPEAFSTRRVHLAQLFFAAKQADGARGLEAAQSRANAAWASLLGGGDFAELARSSSEDEVTKEKGGDLGWIKEGEIDAQLFLTASALAKTEYTRPLQTPYGFHIFRVVEPLETVPAVFDSVKGRLLTELRGEAERQLIERLEKEVAVTKYTERLGAKEGGK